jgi:hydroxypyruvate isomerase
MRTYGLRFDVNCSILFAELPLLARPAAAKAAGFDAVEFWWPFEEMTPADADADALVTALADAGVDLVSLNFHTGDMAAGDRGPPGRGAPGTGTLDFEPLFAQLAAQGYAGSVGLEYLPLDPSDSSTSFSWL